VHVKWKWPFVKYDTKKGIRKHFKRGGKVKKIEVFLKQ